MLPIPSEEVQGATWIQVSGTLPRRRVLQAEEVARARLQREPHEVDRITAHQVGCLQHVTHRVPARMVGVPDRFRDEPRRPWSLDVSVGLSCCWSQRLLDADFRDGPLLLAYHFHLSRTSHRILAAAEDVSAGYDGHGVWTSIEVLTLTLPDILVNDMPYGGDQRPESPVAADDDLASSSEKS